jgi:hypothetical protein
VVDIILFKLLHHPTINVGTVQYNKYVRVDLCTGFSLKATDIINSTVDGSEHGHWFWRVFFSCRVTLKLKHVMRYSVQVDGNCRHTHYLRDV